jgi:hypothetical protein
MAGSLELPALYVEGITDLHTIVHLLDRHGIALNKEVGPVLVKCAKNDDGVLAMMRTAARASTGRPVGFVIDADGAVIDRWRSVCAHLTGLTRDLPAAVPAEGFVQNSPANSASVGVWIMPDNRTDAGQLEHLVKTLIPEQDLLAAHSSEATMRAAALGAQFGRQDFEKAVLHTWLAWQREPGLPFGTAIKSHFFRHDSPVAMQFVAWFRRLYSL